MSDANLQIFMVMMQLFLVKMTDVGQTHLPESLQNSLKIATFVEVFRTSHIAVLGLLSDCGGKETTPEIAATGISLDKTSLTIEKGSNEVLKMSFTPSQNKRDARSWPGMTERAALTCSPKHPYRLA